MRTQKPPIDETMLDDLSRSDKNKDTYHKLRQSAELEIDRKPDEILPATSENIQELIHELRVHQIELEMQNDELRHIQRELELSRDRYSRLFHQAPVGYLTINKDGIITEANETFIGLINASRENLRGKSLAEFIHPDDRTIYLSRFQAFFKQPAGKYLDLRLMRSDQTFFFARLEGRSANLAVSPEKDSASNSLIIIVYDISSQKEWEDKLRDYETMVTSAHDFIGLVDRGYTFRVINDSFAAAFKRQPSEVVGHQISEFYGTEFFNKHIKSYLRRCLSGELTYFRAWFDFPDQKRRYIDCACHPILQDDHTVSGIVLIQRDITRMKVLENQLIQSQKMEAIGTLAGGIAHDFNNLLMGIQGRVSLMLHRLDDLHPLFDDLKSIETYIGDASGLTDQLLGFARGGKYQVRPTDLNRLVQKQIEIFARTKKEISTIVDLNSKIPLVEVDQTQIQQVLLNLFINAWQAMPKGGQLTVRTAFAPLLEDFSQEYKVTPGNYVKITVSDTGVGMDEKTRLRVFEPFFTTKAMGRGTGLGLASVYGIVKNHAGYIEVASEPTKGTTFDIYLPVAPNAMEVRDAMNTMVLEKQKSILIVDDEKMIIEVCQQMLELLGYTVVTADSGEKAIELFLSSGQDFDLVLLDIVMPGLTGEETFDRLKTLKPDQKILLASGYSLDAKALDIMNRDCDGFIQKPYRIEDLDKKISSIFSIH